MSSVKADSPSVFCKEQWICPDWPGYFSDHLAIKVAINPLRCAKTFIKVLNNMALSADIRASSTAIAASSTPGPVSVCSPSKCMSITEHIDKIS